MADEPLTYVCPHCGGAIMPPTSGESFVRCPACGEPLLLANELHDHDAELDGRRVQQVAANRGSAMRVQTYFYVAAAGCLVGGAECVYKAWYAGRWNFTRVLLLALVMCAAYGVFYFLRHAQKIARELRKPLLTEPPTPPDFSRLGDGSQRVRDLENLR